MRQVGLPTLAIGRRINLYECRCQNPFSDSFMALDFSQLRAEGVGMLLTHPLKERSALDAPISCSLILAKKVAAL